MSEFDKYLEEDSPSDFDTLLAQPTVAPTVEAVAQKQKPVGFFENLVTSQPEQPFDWSNVLTSGVVGAGIGSLVAGETAGGGAIAGGVAGLSSGLAGEVFRSKGAPPVVTFASELGGGIVPVSMAKLGAKGYVGVANYKAGRLADLATKENRKFTSDEVKVALAGKEKLFGSSTFKGMFTTENSDLEQIALRNEFNLVGDSSKKASDLARLDYYAKIRGLKDSVEVTRPESGIVPRGVRVGDTLESKPVIFADSPEFKELQKDIVALRQRGDLAEAKDLGHITRIAKNEKSSDGRIEPFSASDMLNLIQNGGIYVSSKKGAEAETKTKITEASRRALETRFDQFLERNVGTAAYGQLKEIERREFEAAAKDSVTTLVDSKFRLGSEAYEKSLANLKRSPSGKNLLVDAVNQHILKFGQEQVTKTGTVVGMETNPQKLVAELHRLRPALIDTGILPKEFFTQTYKKIDTLPKTLSTIKRNQIIATYLSRGMAGAMGSEIADAGKDFKPLDIFRKQ